MAQHSPQPPGMVAYPPSSDQFSPHEPNNQCLSNHGQAKPPHGSVSARHQPCPHPLAGLPPKAALKAHVAFPHLFLITTNLLCAVFYHANSIKGLHFACFTDSYLLAMIMPKGHNKRCHRMSAIIKAITVSLIHLDALPSFKLCDGPLQQDTPVIDIPTPIAKWLRCMRGALPIQ